MSQSKPKSVCCCCLSSSCLLLALLLLAAGAGITHLFAWQFAEQLKVLMPLANGSMSYQGWETVPTELTFEIWLWNVTNPEEIVRRGAKPKLTQVGPFAFRESRYKTDIEFFDNHTVAFREFQVFVYDVSKSVGRLQDFRVTTVNMVYAVTAFQTRTTVAPAFRQMIDRLLRKKSAGLFMTRTADEVLLGYDDPALKTVEPLVKGFAPPEVRKSFQTKSGLFINTNNTHKGLFLVHTGKGDLSQFNQIQRWNGREAIDIWPEQWANQINGTDGSMFSPMVTADKRLKIFTTDICRSLEMEFKGRGSVRGIPSLKFGPVPDLMLNASLKPENKAFCIPHCLDSGVQNITSCQHNVPLAISAPHFTDAATYAAAIEGLNPGQQYRTLIEVEPNTGFVINAGRKMQMNLMLEAEEDFAELKQLPELLLLPLMWLNESGGIEAEAANQFKAHLLAPIQIVDLLHWLLLAAGAATAIVSFGCLLAVCCTRRRRSSRDRGWRRGEKQVSAGHFYPIMPASGGKHLQQRQSLLVDDELIRKLKEGSLRETDII